MSMLSLETAELAAKLIPLITTHRRPRPIVRSVAPAELAWEPVVRPLYTEDDNGAQIRAGESFAIVRPAFARWPLGIVSDHYKVTPHNVTIASLNAFCADRVEPVGQPVMSGHGYHVAHAFAAKHLRANEVNGAPLTSRILVAHDHTGVGSLRASMVVYVAGEAIGSVIGARAIHVCANPQRWQGDIDAMRLVVTATEVRDGS